MPADVIDMAKPWKEIAGTKRSKGRGVSFFEVGALELDLRTEKLFEMVAPQMVEHYRKAVESAKGGPTKGTIKRRGPGPLFRVSGEFVSGVAFDVQGKGKRSVLTLTTGRLSKTVPRWLQFRVPGVRAANLLKAMRRIFEQMVREGIVKQKGRTA